MANSILVLGNSGQGKTSSLMQNKDIGIEGLNPEETFIINVKGKPLPARGWLKYYTPHSASNPKGNMISTANISVIIEYLKNIPVKMPHIKNIILDDSNYLMSETFMKRAKEGGFQKYTDIAKEYFDVINAGINLPHHMNFIVIAHTELDDNGTYKLRTVGKLLDKQINPIGLFTYCLVSSTNVKPDGTTEYGFYTNTTRDSTNTVVPAKTPYGVFEELIIPNDMGYVIKEIEKYNNGE